MVRYPKRQMTVQPSKRLAAALRALQTTCIGAAHHDRDTITVRRTDVAKVVEQFDADLMDL